MLHDAVVAESIKVAHVVRETLFVHDTLIQVAAPAAHGGIGPKEIIGWLVTLIGITIAATVSIKGWKRSARNAKTLQDESNREIMNEVLCEALWNIPIFAKDIGLAIRDGKLVDERLITVMESARKGYDEHWTKTYSYADRQLRRDIVAWFRELEMGRLMLGRFMVGSTLPPADQAKHRDSASAFWIAHARNGRALFTRLGFTSLADDAMRPD